MEFDGAHFAIGWLELQGDLWSLQGVPQHRDMRNRIANQYPRNIASKLSATFTHAARQMWNSQRRVEGIHT